MPGSRKFGDWSGVRRRLERLADQSANAARKAILQEAQYLRGKMVEGIKNQAPGGKKFAPLSPLTLALRELDGFFGTKALVVHGDLRNGITVIDRQNLAFIGVPKAARAKDGHALVDIAQIQEFGTKTYTIRVTDRMREAWRLYKGGGHAERKEQARDAKRAARFSARGGFAALGGPRLERGWEKEEARQQERQKRLAERASLEGLPEFLTIRIPARPFITPVFDAEQPGMKKRIEDRMAKLLGDVVTK